MYQLQEAGEEFSGDFSPKSCVCEFLEELDCAELHLGERKAHLLPRQGGKGQLPPAHQRAPDLAA